MKALNAYFLIILKICQKDPFDITVNDIKMNPWVMSCLHFPMLEEPFDYDVFTLPN